MRALFTFVAALALLSACGGGRPSGESNTDREPPVTPGPVRTLAPLPSPLPLGFENLFGSPNRDRYALCVEAIGVPEGTQAKAVAAIRDAVKEVAKHPIWYRVPPGWTSPNELVVDEGCPIGPTIYRGAHQRTSFSSPQPWVVDEGNYYSEFIFIIPLQDIDATDGDTTRITEWTSEIAESRCADEQCPLTDEAYLSPESLEDQALLVNRVRAIIGFTECEPNVDYGCS